MKFLKLLFIIIIYLFVTSGIYTQVMSEQEFRDSIAVGGIDLDGDTVILSSKPVTITVAGTVIQNGVFILASPKVATLAQDYDADSTTIFVDDASIFEVGDHISIFSGEGYDQGSAHLGQKGRIKEIDTVLNKITTHKTGLNDVQAGAGVIVATQFKMFDPKAQYSFRHNRIHGSRDSQITKDWRYNRITKVITADTFEYNYVEEVAGEVVFHNGGIIRGNVILGCDGSFTHASASNPNEGGAIIEKNIVFGICQAGDLNGHNEGCFTYSKYSQNAIYRDNICWNGRNNCIGNQGLDDENNTIRNNLFVNFNGRIAISPDHPNPDDVSDNIFINVD